MSGAVAPRDFFAPLVGVVLLFTALGPPIGNAHFFPLALALNSPLGTGAVTASARVTAVLGQAIMMIAAYVVGIGPAAMVASQVGLTLRPSPELVRDSGAA